MKYNGYNIPDDVIDSYVDKLGCSIAEACDAWLCDNGKAVCDEQDAMTKKAQFMGVGKVVDAEYKKSERKPRERKIDEEKQLIMNRLWDALWGISDEVIMRNNEKYIDFMYEGHNYTVNLVRHRKKEE